MIRDSKLVFPRRKVESHKAAALSVVSSLATVEKPTGKGSRADGNDSIFNPPFG